MEDIRKGLKRLQNKCKRFLPTEKTPKHAKYQDFL